MKKILLALALIGAATAASAEAARTAEVALPSTATPQLSAPAAGTMSPAVPAAGIVKPLSTSSTKISAPT